MNHLVVFVIVFSCINFTSFSFAKKQEFSFVFTGVDAYSRNKTGGVTIAIYSQEGDSIYANMLGKNGVLEITLELELRAHKVSMIDPSSKYMNYSFDIYLNKKFRQQSVQIDLYPSEKTLKEWIEKEDEIYGDEHSGSLARDLNNETSICGCSFDEIEDATFGTEQSELFKYISRSINYPQQSIENGEQGRVYAKFIVESNGKISHVVIERGVSPLIDAETMRVIRQMPLWNPAICKNEKVRMVVRIPVAYSLN